MNSVHTTLLYHFCRLRLPQVRLPADAFERHSLRAFEMFRASAKQGMETTWRDFVDNLYALDWFIACACLEGLEEGWRALFHARANRTDALLIDALRSAPVRLFPRDPERQEEAVAEFWGFLLAGEREGSAPVLARYDGQRPLVPWLIRVFQNKHLSELRHDRGRHALPDEDLDDRDLPFPSDGDDRWHEEFRQAAREWLRDLPNNEALILGLRMRYRLSQREAAAVLGINEGNVSRRPPSCATAFWSASAVGSRNSAGPATTSADTSSKKWTPCCWTNRASPPTAWPPCSPRAGKKQ